MAKLVGGPLGSYRGKAGGTIGSSWKGIAVVKSMPLSVANPQTVAQTAQRVKFAACIAVARLLLSDLITTFWNPFAKRMSGINAFVKQNIDCFTGGEFATPADFSAARGILMGVSGLAVAGWIAEAELSLTWDDNSGTGDALATDVPMILLMNMNTGKWDFYASDNTRDAGTMEWTPDLATSEDDVCHIYFFFARPDHSKVSDSYHLQYTVTAA